MKKKSKSTATTTELRRRAEAKLRKQRKAQHAKQVDAQRLLHELQVHQIELEMQNTELRVTRDAAEALSEKYNDLYDFAPVGYCTVSEKGLILEANLTGAKLLGVARSTLVGQPLKRFILPEDQDIYARYRQQVFQSHSTSSPQQCELRMLNKGKAIFWALLQASDAKAADGAPVCHIALSDITKHKQTKQELEESSQQLRFETLLADLSVRFLNLPVDQVDAVIEGAQRQVCEWAGLDVCVLWQWEVDTPGVFTLTHHYRRVDGPPLSRQIQASETFPWSLREVQAGRAIIISSLDDVLTGAERDLEAFRHFGVKNVLVLPLTTGGGAPFGAVSFHDMVTPRPWAEPLVKRLELVAHVFANAILRKRSDQALRESEARLSLAAESAGVGLWSLDLASQHFWLTPKTRELLGFSPDESVSWQRVLEVIHSEDRGRVERALQEVVLTGEEGRVEYRVPQSDGSVRWLLLRGRLRQDSPSSPRCVMGVTVDITERKLAELVLRENEVRLEEAADVAALGFYEMRGPGRQEFQDARIQSILGLPKDLVSGIREFWVEHLHPEDRDRVLDLSRQILEGSLNGVAAEYRYLHPQRGVVWLRHAARVFERDAQGRTLRVLGVMQDITEYKLAEEALRKSVERFRQVAELAGEFIWEVDASGLYTYASPSVERILGYAPSELVGKKHFYDLFEPSIRKELKAGAFRVFAARQEFRDFPNPNVSKSGKIVHLETSGAPMLDPAGNLTGYRGVDTNITERRQAEFKLATLARAVESTTELICITDLQDRFVFVNRAFQKAYGYTEEELLGKSPEILYSSHNPTPLGEILKQTRLGGWRGDVLDRRKDGTEFPVSLSTSSVKDQNGRVIGLIGIAQDITERRRTDSALRASEERFRALAESALVGIYVLQDGKYAYVNPAMASVFGYSVAEMTGMSPRDIVQPCDHGMVGENIRRQIDGEVKTMQYEVRGRHKDGSTRDVEVYGTRLEMSGRPALVGTLIDVTERKRAEKSLRESVERFRQVAEISDEFIWEVDAEGLYTYASPSVGKILGYTPDEVVGKKHFYDLFDPVVREELKAAALQAFAARQPFQNFPNPNISKSGKMVQLETSGVPMLDPAGNLVGCRGADTDVTARRESEMELGQQRNELAHLSRVAMLGELSGSLAHELNQPLTAILSNAQAAQRFLSEGNVDLNEIREILRDIITDDQRAGEVIRRLRLLLKKGEVHHLPLDLNEIVQDVLKLIRNDLLNQSIKLQTEFTSDLPVIEGDRVQLQQVLLNLIVNAADAMANAALADRQLTVRTEHIPEGGIRVSVGDRGAGLTPEVLEKIFNPFFTTKSTGMGLGLKVCRTIIAAHGGQLAGENNPDKGATFSFTLPAAGKKVIGSQ